MTALFVALLAWLRSTTHSRLELAAEILAVKLQLAVLQRTNPKRPRLRRIDRPLWVLLSSVWPDCLLALEFDTQSRRTAGAGPDLRALIRQTRRHRDQLILRPRRRCVTTA